MSKKNKDLKNNRHDFYVYRVQRDNEPTEQQEDTQETETKYIISPHYGKQPAKPMFEGMGYHRDPSSYDCIRPTGSTKPSEPEDEVSVVKPVIPTSPQVEETEKPVNEPLRGDYIQPIINEEELSGSIDDLPTDIFLDDEVHPPKTPTVTLPKPRVAEPLKELEEKRNPIVEVKAPKLVKYIPPKLELLVRGQATTNDDKVEAERQKATINQTFNECGIKAEVADYIFGPTVTQFLIKIAPGVNVNVINSCKDNLTMYLEVERIRIQTPIPGKAFAGIEVPKKEEFRHTVYLGDILATKEFRESKANLPVVVGKDNSGNSMICDISLMPHCLIAGTTQSGKSVCLNSFIMSLLYRFSPRDLRIVLMDPKRIEFSPYENTPHLAMPVITDREDFPAALGWVYEEMEKRYEIFAYYGEDNLKKVNAELAKDKKPHLPYIVTIIDEFGDWLSDAGPEVEDMMKKIAAKARAAGIHVILATQRPSKDVINGTIKANFDTRLAFKVSSYEDSRVILGYGGAEKLEGHGDVLIRYAGKTDKRIQGAFISKSEIKAVVNYLTTNNKCDYLITKEEIHQSTLSRQTSDTTTTNSRMTGLNDERFEEVAYYIVRNKNASNNSLGKEFNMGFNRINDILIALEKLGVLSSAVKGKQREVLIDEFQLEDVLKKVL